VTRSIPSSGVTATLVGTSSVVTGTTVTVVVATPPDASAGNYAVAWFEAVPEAQPKAKELRVGARIGVLVMTEVRGASKPNVLIILADDMGFSDLGCYGSEIATPRWTPAPGTNAPSRKCPLNSG